MVERLSEELTEQLRLGLLGPTMARELARLPRGNQEEVLEVTRSHNLGTREAARLVEAFKGASEDKKSWVLAHPMEAISNRSSRPPRKRDPRLSDAVAALVEFLKRTRGVCEGLRMRLTQEGIPEHTETERQVLVNRLREVYVSLQVSGHVLNKAIMELDHASRPPNTTTARPQTGHGSKAGPVQPQAGPQTPHQSQPGPEAACRL